MSLLKEDQDVTADLRRQRDEIKVRLHLLKMEAREDWDELEKKYQLLQARLKIVSEAAGKSSDEVRLAAKALANEIKDGYKRIKSSF